MSILVHVRRLDEGVSETVADAETRRAVETIRQSTAMVLGIAEGVVSGSAAFLC
jgi:hypothetical protein